MAILFALILAVVMSFFFAALFGNRESSGIPVMLVFIILLFSGVSAQYWIAPFGPLAWGIAWVPLFGTMIIIALLLAATSSSPRRVGKRNDAASDETAAAVTVSIFIWILLGILIVAAISGYYREVL